MADPWLAAELTIKIQEMLRRVIGVMIRKPLGFAYIGIGNIQINHFLRHAHRTKHLRRKQGCLIDGIMTMQPAEPGRIGRGEETQGVNPQGVDRD